MRLLLDTHVLLWISEDAQRLRSDVRRILADTTNAIYVSLVSIWEVAIKQAKGKIPLDAKDLLDGLPPRFTLMPIRPEQVIATRHLPLHHGDPFDRLLIAQAQLEGLTIATHDEGFRQYGVPILWT